MVQTGLERWLTDPLVGARFSKGVRLGLLAHPSSIDRQGFHAVERIMAHPDLDLVRLFAPEHGLRGEAQDMESVAEELDEFSKLPIVSLYGESLESLKPKPSDFEGLDALVVDLQDVGTRFYTFIYTMAFCMEVAATRQVPVIVLDRPNPIGGLKVEGPILDTERWSSFVGVYPLPVRHGMTIGELALLFHGLFGIGEKPIVIKMDGWERAMQYPDTGLPWVAPSPNMPTWQTACVYPGGCLIEGTNLSEARGTTRPFELIGAPELDEYQWVSQLRRYAFEGVSFRATTFRPEFQKHAGRTCRGIQVMPSKLNKFQPFLTYLAIIREALKLHPKTFQWRTEPYEFEQERLAIDLLLGRTGLREMLESEIPLKEMERSWQSELDQWDQIRSAYFLYN